MHRKDPRKSCRVHDRKIDRLVAKHNMKKAGVPKPNKHFQTWREWAVAGEEKR